MRPKDNLPKQPRTHQMGGPSATLSEISSLDTPHPYGVMPGGNRFFSTSKRRTEEIFPDDLWQQILSFCDGNSLGRIVQTSRYLYVAGHQLELWRDLVLRAAYSQKLSLSDAGHTWKDTFVATFASRTSTYPPHKPMSVPGIYSDSLYQTHICRAFAIPASWLKASPPNHDNRSEVARIPFEELSPAQFFETYEQPNLPVIVERAGQHTAIEKWQDPEYLRLHVKDGATFRTTSGAAPLPCDFTLPAFQKYCKFPYLEESPLYLFDRTAFSSTEGLYDDFFPAFHERCKFWDPTAEHGHDLFQHLGQNERPDHTWLISGAKRSGSVFHIDPNCTHAWNACVVGRKRWILYPPGVTPPGVFPSADGDEVALPLSVGEWLTRFWEEHLQRHRSGPINDRPLECTVEPGDVIFVPHGWWHMVVNLDDVNIAITHNYVSRNNLGNVLRFLHDKQDQISGCRDRAESVKPEQLRSEFVKVLQEKEPESLKSALGQPGWTCKAWGKNDQDMPGDTGHQSLALRPLAKKQRLEKTDGDDNTKTISRSIVADMQRDTAFSFSFM